MELFYTPTEFQHNRAIGQRIHRLRRSLRPVVTARRFAAQLHISPRQLRDYEQGTSFISATKLALLAETFGVPVAALLCPLPPVPTPADIPQAQLGGTCLSGVASPLKRV